mmetsp:Transcript_8776/g.27395  ORF Transcript_8776/g.27395 Transcript_8776/m.27395 type:complete len:182 (+) Transcript_8776:234-779(+)
MASASALAPAPAVAPPSLGTARWLRWLGKRAWRSLQRWWRLRVTGNYKRRAGGLVLRLVEGREEVLLISSRKDPATWILPAGTVERGETLRETALREVLEEAGVECAFSEPAELGEYADDARLVRTAVYVMRVARDRGAWEDEDLGRRRRWWAVDEASAKLKTRDRRPLEAYLARRAAPAR